MTMITDDLSKNVSVFYKNIFRHQSGQNWTHWHGEDNVILVLVSNRQVAAPINEARCFSTDFATTASLQAGAGFMRLW